MLEYEVDLRYDEVSKGEEPATIELSLFHYRGESNRSAFLEAEARRSFFCPLAQLASFLDYSPELHLKTQQAVVKIILSCAAGSGDTEVALERQLFGVIFVLLDQSDESLLTQVLTASAKSLSESNDLRETLKQSLLLFVGNPLSETGGRCVTSEHQTWYLLPSANARSLLIYAFDAYGRCIVAGVATARSPDARPARLMNVVGEFFRMDLKDLRLEK